MMPRPLTAVPAALTLILLGCSAEPVDPNPQMVESPLAMATAFDASWSAAENLELSVPGADEGFNTSSAEGCPFVSRDGKSFYIASNRPGTMGGQDIWVSTRASTDEPWGEPVNVGAPVNSAANDYCPTLDRDGHRFFFVSTRVIEGVSCGAGDIYETRLLSDGTYAEPKNLGCDVNSEYDEFSPFPLPEAGSAPVLYFSSKRPGVGGMPGDIYRSESHGGVFGPAELVRGVNSDADDGMPNVRRDGLEMFFYSTRTDLANAQGGPDLYSSTRASTSEDWSQPVNLGPQVNGPGGDTRPSLSWDGRTLYFGSVRDGVEGASDIYVVHR